MSGSKMGVKIVSSMVNEITVNLAFIPCRYLDGKPRFHLIFEQSVHQSMRNKLQIIRCEGIGKVYVRLMPRRHGVC